MDLSQLNVSAAGSSELTLRHPATGEDLYDGDNPVTVTLLGKDSKEYRQAVARTANSRLRNRKVQTVEQAQQDGIDLLSAVTLGWQGITENGEPLECTQHEVKRVYREYAWIREQVDEFVDDRSNFLTSA